MTSERDVHPDEGTIHAWLDRQLDDASSATLEAHLQRCDECAERVAEARGLIAGASRILGALDRDEPATLTRDAGAPTSVRAVEPVRSPVLPTTRALGMPTFRLTPARSAIAAVLVVAAAMAIVHENERPSSRLARVAAESAAVANSAAATPLAGAPAAAPTTPMVAAAPMSAASGAAPVAPPATSPLDSTAGTRVAAARAFAKAQRETTVNADLARVAQAPAPVASTPVEPIRAASRAAGVEAPQCYRVESATGAAATWGPVSLPFLLALDAPAASAEARVLTPAGQDAEARAVFERRGGDSLFFTLRRIGYTGTLAVGVPGDVRAGVMRSAPSKLQLESVVVTSAPRAGAQKRALREPSAAQRRADSTASAAEREAAPAMPVVVRKVDCSGAK